MCVWKYYLNILKRSFVRYNIRLYMIQDEIQEEFRVT